MVTLTLRVERSSNEVPRLVFQQSDIDSAIVQGALADIPSGTYVQADCEWIASVGLRAVEILAITAHSQPSPRTSIRALVDKGDFERALEELETFGPGRVESEPQLLLARCVARIGRGDEAGALGDLRALLAMPGVTTLDVRDAFQRFNERFGAAASQPVSRELVAWVDSRKPSRAMSYLNMVEPSLWPIDLLISELEDAVAAEPGDPARVKALLDVARSSASHDPRVRGLWARAASRGLAPGRPSDPVSSK